jgi:hypothetical protein
MNQEKYLNVSERKTYINAKHISTNIDFFNTESVIIKVYDDKIVFRKPDISYRGKTFMIQKLKTSNNWYSFGITSDLIPLGKLYPSIEFSNEDELVFFYNEENEC